MSLSIGSVITDVTLESLSASNQSNVPFTFGQVFKQGDMLSSENLTGRIGKTEQPLQYEVKATHNDGSVRHAIISGVLPSLAAKDAPVMQLVKTAPVASTPFASAACVASVSATIAGEKYFATVDNTHLPNATWLSGSIVQEKHFNVPLTTAAGKAHPHLYARFAMRDYGSNVRVDVTVENNWAYEPSPQNFTYDTEVVIDGSVVYSKTALKHFHHARWRRMFWTGVSPQVNVKLNTEYLISTKAVPNYDMSAPPAEDLLKNWSSARLSTVAEPMSVGLATSYMPQTGAHEDIGILPLWQAAYVLSMDVRARDASLITANGAGSWSMHYRDKVTNLPVTLTDHPAMTILGRSTDAGKDAFPGTVGDSATPYTHDTAHQPSFAYLPYLVTGDYFYLEEMQFWALYNAFNDNPGYRGYVKGLVIPAQVRGQAWSLRTLVQAAFATPDTHPLKKELSRIVGCNFDQYNDAYTEGGSNKLGVITNGYAVEYNGNTGIAPWQDDHFTSTVGHAVELGFEKALPLLKWKAQFQIGRMIDPNFCWIDAAAYSLKIRDTSTAPFYTTLGEVYKNSVNPKVFSLKCNSVEQLAARNSIRASDERNAFVENDMPGYASSLAGYPSNFQPALAMTVDSGYEGGFKAWEIFANRAVRPDYRNGPTFSIVPRTKKIAVPELPPITPNPEEPKMTFKVSVAYATAVQTLPAGTEATANHTLVELLAADGTTVVASSSDSKEFTGINAGNYVARVSGIDSKGAVMGVPATVAFTIEEEVVTPPAPTTVDVMLPSAITVSYVKE